MYDVIIIGAGPSGATLARLIGNTRKVLLIDRRFLLSEKSNGFPLKTCGGLLAPDAQKIIARMGLGVPMNVLTSPQLFTVRTIDIKNSNEKFYQRHYINLDREKFDRWLVSLIPSAVEMRFGATFKSFNEIRGKIEVKFIYDGKEYIESSKMLVAADGAFSNIRKIAFPFKPAPKLYIGVQESCEAETVLPYFSAIFDSEITDFYSWTIPKEKTLIIGSAIHPGSDALTKFGLLKNKLLKYGYKFKDGGQKSGSFINRPVKTGQICTGNSKIALVGEAAGWISPSSSEGLSYSFISAVELSRAILESPGNVGKAYYNNSRHLKQKIFIKNQKSHFMYNPNLRNIVMRSGYKSMKMYDLFP